MSSPIKMIYKETGEIIDVYSFFENGMAIIFNKDEKKWSNVSVNSLIPLSASRNERNVEIETIESINKQFEWLKATGRI